MVHMHELGGLVSSSDRDGVQGAVWIIDLVTLKIISSGLGEDQEMTLF